MSRGYRTPLGLRSAPDGTHQGTAVLRAVSGPVLRQPLLLLVEWLGLENHFFKFERGVAIQSPFLQGKYGLPVTGFHFHSFVESVTAYSCGDVSVAWFFFSFF